MSDSDIGVSASARHAARANCLESLYVETMAEALVGIILAVVAVTVLWNPRAPVPLLGWLGAIALSYALRLALREGYIRSPARHGHTMAWSILFLLGMAMSAAPWGYLVVAMHAGLTAHEQSFLLLSAACMVLCALAVYRGAPLAVVPSALAALLPPAAYLLTQSEGPLPALGGVAAICSIAAVAAALRIDPMLIGSFDLRDRFRRLSGELKVKTDEVGVLDVAVKSNLARCDELASQLSEASTSLGNAKRKSEVLSEILGRVTPRCSVTGLTNQRRFLEVLDAEWRRLMRDGKPLSLLMFEIDEGDGNGAFYLRSVAGTECLRRIAEVTNGYARRAGDLAIRYGDTCFGLLLPGADTVNARRIAEDLRRDIEKSRIAHFVPGATGDVTVHVGVATLVPSADTAPMDLLGRIEDATYRARFQGGNRVVSYQTMDTFSLVRWDLEAHGKPSEQALVDKLSTMGYRAGKSHLAHDKIADRCPEVPSACAVVSGKLGLNIEGQCFELDRGDCLFLPKGTTYSARVLGTEPVRLLEASKAS